MTSQTLQLSLRGGAAVYGLLLGKGMWTADGLVLRRSKGRHAAVSSALKGEQSF